MKIQRQIDVKGFESRKGFIYDYQKLIKDVVIPYQYAVLHDQVEGVEKSHVVSNFENAAKAVRGEDVGDGFYGMVFQDSDAAKWLEAAAYSLAVFPDKDLEQKADVLIEKIAAAQDTDGYLNTYFTIKDREKRWTNLLEGHELYCAGHMMEAAAAYFETTGKDRLLKVMLKNAEHIYQKFVVEGKEGYPGHPEVELALLRMYRAANDEKCLELAKHFIDVRGVDREFYKREVESRDWKVWGNDASDYDYQQSGKPVREQSDATGHSVRAVYLYTGMADLASETGDEELRAACKRLFESIRERRMYVTGGIGSTALGEAFTVDYHLPNDTAYAETCASIGLMFFASRMLEMEVDSVYSDVMERAFYNTVLAGMQLDGRRFFYVNPLEVIPGISGEAATHKHALPQRPGWYTCACCPPNVARCIASIGRYAYGENETTAFIHLFMEGKASLKNGFVLDCETKYPYEMKAVYRVLAGNGTVAVREPDWSRDSFRILVNGSEQAGNYARGYRYLEGIKAGDVIEVVFDDRVKRIYASAKVSSDSGYAALQRGPLVYCVEGIDNEGDVLSLSYAEEGKVEIGEFEPELLNGTIKLRAEGYRTVQNQSLYTYEKQKRERCIITAVPYYTWGNRGLGQMRVWLPERP
ncbi:MAG: glycoside hydrolase family 127 protein [Lachnospiraceae bacterium]|nr:glycoside hydrolase family 127 protein [Lachnospiraceae bacterium]